MRFASLLALFPFLAGAGQFSGTLTDLSGAPLAGVTVTAASGAFSSTSDALGSWNSTVSNGIAQRHSASAPQLRALELQDGRIRLAWQGKDISGRGEAKGTAWAGAPACARNMATTDTLVVRWRNRRLVRLPVSQDSSGIALAIDTAWADDHGLPWNPAIRYGSVSDSAGRTYRTVTIGSRTWMAENLATRGPDTATSLCNGRATCDTFGYLYTWAGAMGFPKAYDRSEAGVNARTVQGACPTGWHVPSLAQWHELISSGMDSSQAGAKLKAVKGWEKNSRWSRDGNGTDAFGFRALPGSYSNGIGGLWWSATEDDAWYARNRGIAAGQTDVSGWGTFKTYAFSLRCVKN